MKKRFLSSVFKGITHFFFRTEVLGRENLPDKGGYILASNHKSNWDAPFITSHLSDIFIYYLAKAELFKIKPLGAIIKSYGAIPVDRSGRNINVVKQSVELLKNGKILCVFPEGTRVRKGKKPTPKKGAVRMASLAGVPIVPVLLRGDYTLFKKCTLVIGKPINIGAELSEEEIAEHTKELMENIYSL